VRKILLLSLLLLSIQLNADYLFSPGKNALILKSDEINYDSIKNKINLNKYFSTQSEIQEKNLAIDRINDELKNYSINRKKYISLLKNLNESIDIFKDEMMNLEFQFLYLVGFKYNDRNLDKKSLSNISRELIIPKILNILGDIIISETLIINSRKISDEVISIEKGKVIADKKISFSKTFNKSFIYCGLIKLKHSFKLSKTEEIKLKNDVILKEMVIDLKKETFDKKYFQQIFGLGDKDLNEIEMFKSKNEEIDNIKEREKQEKIINNFEQKYWNVLNKITEFDSNSKFNDFLNKNKASIVQLDSSLISNIKIQIKKKIKNLRSVKDKTYKQATTNVIATGDKRHEISSKIISLISNIENDYNKSKSNERITTIKNYEFDSETVKQEKNNEFKINKAYVYISPNEDINDSYSITTVVELIENDDKLENEASKSTYYYSLIIFPLILFFFYLRKSKKKYKCKILMLQNDPQVIIPWNKGVVSLGKSLKNDINTNFPDVSEKHITFEINNNRISIIDNNSDMGTFIDEQIISGNHNITNLDKFLRIGEVLKFKISFENDNLFLEIIPLNQLNLKLHNSDSNQYPREYTKIIFLKNKIYLRKLDTTIERYNSGVTSLNKKLNISNRNTI